MPPVVFLKSRANFRGGLEKYTHHLMQAFAAKGSPLTLLTTGTPPLAEGISSISLAPNTKFTLLHLLRFDYLCKKWLRENPQDIVFGMERTTCQTHYRAGSGVHAVYLKRRTLIDPFWKQLSCKVNPLHRTLLALEKKAFEAPELKVLFTNSYMVREEILNTYNVSPAKIEVVHNGVEWNAWSKPFEQTFPRKKIAPYHLLFIGNGYKRKGLLFLLQGLALLKNEDFTLTVIGKDKNPAFFTKWAAQQGLSDKIRFLGPQNDVLPFYQSADALVIPSIYDPFANVTVEALAMGLYVVSSPYNGGHEVLQPHSGTLIQDITSPESMASSLKLAFAHPKTEAQARAIRQSVQSLDFSTQLDTIVRKTLATSL